MLRPYEEKRDFRATTEPGAGRPAGHGALRFVVQKHAARRLHYDFRLELDGTLKSWAVPKGPSLNVKEKRLAVMVEDHPLDYAHFEGVIGDGNYGAGQVIVWDSGLYSPDDGALAFDDRDAAQARMRAQIDAGKLSFTLRGRKLRGSWTIVKTARAKNEWLLIKHRDGFDDDERDILDEDRSVVSGLSLDELKAGRLPDPSRTASTSDVGQPAALPKRLQPMLARSTDAAFTDDRWLFEPKLDGFRAVALLQAGSVRLLSRTGRDMTAAFPEIAAELEAQPQDDMALDGEIVALDKKGRPSFQLMQGRSGLPRFGSPRSGPKPSEPAAVIYYPFDLVHLNGRSLRRVPLEERKRLLELAVVPGDHVRLVEQVVGEGEAFFHAATRLGFEGVVAKRRDGHYEPGKRSPGWLKIKREQSQELVIAGYTPGEGERASTFGALVVGYYEGRELHYAGRVGTGFSHETLEELLTMMEPLRTGETPFAAVPPFTDLPNGDIEGTQWVRPELVAQVTFAEWTGDGVLRAPVFVGLRGDVPPATVVREVAEPPEAFDTPTPSGGGAPARSVRAPRRRSGQDSGASARTSTPAGQGPAAVEGVLEQLALAGGSLKLQVADHTVALTNLDKPMWPATADRPAITKRDAIRYYASVAPLLLPHLRDRPLTLTRYPNGVDGDSFYQKHVEHLPPFVETVHLFSSSNEGNQDYVTVNNLPTLIWLAQLADLEMHPWLSRTVAGPDGEQLGLDFANSEESINASALNYPDFIAFDLDPYIYSGDEKPRDEPELHRKGYAKTVEMALALKEILDQLSLSSFVKTSGKTGLHIYVPVLRQYDYTLTRKACELIGRFLLRQHPFELTLEWSVRKREGKVFFDHNMNTRGKNMASVYSLRPLPGAPVSTPVSWAELPDVYPTDFTIDTVPERFARVGDLWGDILGAKHDLRRLLEADGEAS